MIMYVVNSLSGHKQSPIWKYFVITDRRKFLASCKVCYKLISYRTAMSNLQKHLRRHGINEQDETVITKQPSDDEEGTVEALETYFEDVADQTENSSSGHKNSPVWKYYEITDHTNCLASCKICNEELSYRTALTNLQKHLREHCINNQVKNKITKVSDDEEGSIEALKTYLDDEDVEEEQIEQPIDKRRILRCGAWQYFEVVDEEEKVASCNFCKQQFSYRTSSTNLAKHLKRKHYSEIEDTEFLDEEDEKSTSEKQVSSIGGKRSIAWEYFTQTDPERRIATCKLCKKSCSYMTSVTNLMKHVKRKHTNILDDLEFDNDGRYLTDSRYRKRSSLWLYFKCIDNKAKISVCLICKRQLSHLTSTSNLKRHLYRKHPRIKLEENDDKQMLVASDGQLYEIEGTDDGAAKMETLEVNDDDNDDQTDPMELDAIYLHDYEENTEPERKLKSLATKRKRKRLHFSDDNDSSDEVTLTKRYVKKKPDSLDQFGKYLVSLLKQLPKELSNQLQADFVKQVMAAELSYNSQKVVVTPSNGYAITITETRPTGSNDGDNEQYVANATDVGSVES